MSNILLPGKAVTIWHTIMTFNELVLETLINNVGNRENAGNQHFFHILTMFSALPKTNFNF